MFYDDVEVNKLNKDIDRKSPDFVPYDQLEPIVSFAVLNVYSR